MNSERMKSIADKWERLTSIGWGFKSQSDLAARLNNSMDRMSHRQMDILIVLDCMEINTISEMAEFLKISKSTLSIIMNKLVAKEFVVKEYPAGGCDGRRVYFKISPKGKEIFKRLGRQYVNGLSEFYGRFNDEGKKLFSEGVACFRKSTNAEKTLIAIMTSHDDGEGEYSEGLLQIAKDIAFFFINCHVINLSEEKALPHQFTQNQFHLLLCILNGMDTLTKLERHLGSSGSTLSIGVSKLVEKGYLYKEYPDAGQDGRMVFIRVTDKGKEIIGDTRQVLNDNFVKYLASLSEENVAMFEQGCDYLLEAFEHIMR